MRVCRLRIRALSYEPAKEQRDIFCHRILVSEVPRSLSDIDRPPLAENLQMGYQLFYPTHAMEAP